ncbi:hypothetical protein HGM15179_016941 [Zosterops borbonicus]|uniref:Uncharacterized protein n=1 Tax=Zosterops borbonicus TaxID=364589 RepID=A0A8K1G1W5_9PASS|nr:hypothetical protein HGM15179_017167 [Zosterops borbonicus]TRZ10166.1 hypothetical protein HGM15179_016941 [Zosterops borbonicus]
MQRSYDYYSDRIDTKLQLLYNFFEYAHCFYIDNIVRRVIYDLSKPQELPLRHGEEQELRGLEPDLTLTVFVTLFQSLFLAF